MKAQETKYSTPDPEDSLTIEMLDTLGYLRNGSSIWTLVSKDLDVDVDRTFAGMHFECSKQGGAPFEILSSDIIRHLVSLGYINPQTRLDGNNANNKVLSFELEPAGEQWYLAEYPRWKKHLHHTFT